MTAFEVNKIFDSAKAALIEGDEVSLDRLIVENPELFRSHHSPPYVPSGPGPNFKSADAKTIISEEHHFSSYSEFENFKITLRDKNSSVAKFEAAVEAIIHGRDAELRHILGENPWLVKERSARRHCCMLLHYLGANGIEGFRQKTPKNAVAIAKILLDADAEVDAVSGAYGKDTTLGLVATSIHPLLAGLQIELMQILIDAGASVEGAPGGWNPLIACLHNGRGEAAEYLASRGAKLDLEGAAGTGNLEVVKSYFNEDGSFKSNDSIPQMESGFKWACEYGKNQVVEFLIEKGVNIHTGENTGMTGLHWAIVGAQIKTVELLLNRGANPEALNEYGGTALSQSLWCVANLENQKAFIPVIEKLLSAGSKIEDGTLSWLAKQEQVSTSTSSKLEDVLKKYGAKS